MVSCFDCTHLVMDKDYSFKCRKGFFERMKKEDVKSNDGSPCFLFKEIIG